MLKQDTTPSELAAELLGEYRVGSSFFLSSPQGTLLAQGEFARMPAQGGGNELAGLPGGVAAFLEEMKQRGHSAPIVVGAVPFDHLKPAHLVVPATCRWAGPLVPDPADRADEPLGGAYAMSAVPQPAEYENGVKEILLRLEQTGLRKVVLSRSLHLSSAQAVNVHGLLRNLARHNAEGYTFAVNLPDRESDGAARAGESSGAGPRTLLGASPELLVAKSGLKIRANPLAGSAARSEDPAEDRRRADALLASAKDRHEHAVVIEAVAAALRPYCASLEVPAEPSLVRTKTMWHLSSELTGELIDPSTPVLALAAALHPTPAVCGAPTELARQAIRDIEPFDRGYFTGMVGWCDANGDGQWIVTIRCAEVQDRSLRLFAGAGVVAGSTPEGELAETSAKFRTLLLAMGINP